MVPLLAEAVPRDLKFEKHWANVASINHTVSGMCLSSINALRTPGFTLILSRYQVYEYWLLHRTVGTNVEHQNYCRIKCDIVWSCRLLPTFL
jgi:hypothetical protein